MRNQMLLLTAVLLVGVASVSATAFYLSPNKEIALFGNPANISPTEGIPPGEAVAGVSEQRGILPEELPYPTDCETLSFLKTNGRYQLVCQLDSSLFLAVRQFSALARAKHWRIASTDLQNRVYRLRATRASRRLHATFIRDRERDKTVVTILLTRSSAN